LFDDLRKPVFIVAIILMALAVLVELGSMALLSQQVAGAAALNAPTPGRGIPTLALLDALVLYAAVVMGIALIMPERIQGRLQGIVSLIVAILLLLACIPVIIGEFVFLILMVSLLFAPPFGTIVYFALWSSFDTTGARIALSLIMTLKLGFAACLVIAHQGFLKMKGLLLIIITSLVATLVLAFLQGFVPGFLVTPADDIGAIIICVLVIIWGLVYAIGGVISVVKAVVNTVV
jgi:hypothetical protein